MVEGSWLLAFRVAGSVVLFDMKILNKRGAAAASRVTIAMIDLSKKVYEP